MRFAIATNDGYQGVLESFLRAGWQLDKLFVSPGNWMYDNKQVIARTLALGAEIQYSPVTPPDLSALGQGGCDALIVATYEWKIPAWEADLKYAVNFHPSPLPEGRGPYPLVRAILEERTSWAVTCHRINACFDQGDILEAESFSIDADECHESLRAKSQMAASRLADRIADEFELYWSEAQPQEAGSYWPRWSDQDKTIDFSQPVCVIMQKIRAFGDIECIAMINDVNIFIHRAKGWSEFHLSRPGAVVHSSDLSLVVAAADGFIVITEWSFNAPGRITTSTRR